jgi:hypothetical protein
LFNVLSSNNKMSFTNAMYDTCKSQEDVRKSAGPGLYILQTPATNCDPCFNPDPHMRIQQNGAAVCRGEITDLDSEFMGLTKKSQNCNHDNGTNPSDKCNPKMEEDCSNAMRKIHSRMTNPPCAYRGIGYNRWEWLCENPQKYAMRPFQTQTNSRQVMKDNFRPCIKEPWESARTPNPEIECAYNIDDTPQVNVGAHQAIIDDGMLPEQGNRNPPKASPMVSWQHCNVIQNY